MADWNALAEPLRRAEAEHGVLQRHHTDWGPRKRHCASLIVAATITQSDYTALPLFRNRTRIHPTDEPFRNLVYKLIMYRPRCPPRPRGGITFLNLEDETGMANVIVSVGLWRKCRNMWLNNSALLVRGIAQVGQGTVSLVADQVTPVDLKSLASGSRDFR
ncbi:OB-fold nucleic acid binding domain-containing protein [Amycolatopsis sp. CA-161197]|uniref:OB-fold nucleic acid binding domain-containing protein n=1 Tax=Amycolatopsis sp. CA-161197 TaxID=3239922 RepID=UPI003D93BB93